MNNYRYPLLLLGLALTLPVQAQSTAQLKQENERLRAELQALQAQCTPSSGSSQVPWTQGEVEARLDTLRVSPPRYDGGRADIVATLTLRNTGSTPLALNYLHDSWSATDNNGYRYSVSVAAPISGIPEAYGDRADPSAVIMPGRSRTVTVPARRDMSTGQTPGNRYDLNITFVQVEDLGQGRVRKVRDFPVAFTNVPPSTDGLPASLSSPGAKPVLERAAGKLLERLGR